MIPQVVRVRLVSEEAGAVSITPVVVQDLLIKELADKIIEHVGGKDVPRIRRLLAGGTLVTGASRFIWDGFQVSEQALCSLLDTYPDDDPDRPFVMEECVLAVFRLKSGRSIELPRETARRRRWFRSRCFWEEFLSLLRAEAPVYRDYSYREKADCYILQLSPSALSLLRRAAPLLVHTQLSRLFENTEIISVELYVPRSRQMG